MSARTNGNDPPPAISVVVATYNRPQLLSRLVQQIAAQTLDQRLFEMVVVDDGSREDPRPIVEALKVPFKLTLLRQANAGAAAARHRGAMHARGDVILFTDDDMQVAPALLEEHLAAHREHPRAVVLGRVKNDDSIVDMPVFERFHAHQIDVEGDAFRDGKPPHGGNLFTGNVSMKRADYLAVGGFDQSLGHSEDIELGFRLEKSGVNFVFRDAAYTIHGSDHTKLDKWLARAFKYGTFDLRIAGKHPELAHANPWRFLTMVNPVSRPLLVASLIVPRATKPLSKLAMAVSLGVDRLGLERLAIHGTTLVFGMEYFRGMRNELGGVAEAARSYRAFVSRHRSEGGTMGAIARFFGAIRADHEFLQRTHAKYLKEEPAPFSRDLVQRIGMQIIASVRLMRLFQDAKVPLAPKVTSRMIRLVFGSDIHWEAEFVDGVAIIHGFGLAIARSVKVGSGCVLFQNVTLAEAADPKTRIVGGPTLEDDVHVGPGSTLIGPITIGKGSKIMAGCVLNQSVPPYSVVTAPTPTISTRARSDEDAPRKREGSRQ